MKILFLGDVVGRAGRRAVTGRLGALRTRLGADLVILDAENASAGMGLSPEHAKALLDAGADVLTLGDHAFDQKDMQGFIEREPRILRPVNFAKAPPGRGHGLFEARGGGRVLVAPVLGQVFMKRPFDDPFAALDRLLKTYPLGGQADAVIIEAHAEATSEKMAMGHFCDGRATAVIGTHTHVPTADVQILPGGTAYQSDTGMCGDYDSVIGMDKAEPMRRFVTGMSSARFTPADGEATLCGLMVETDVAGRARAATPIREGGRLAASTQ